jgi:hypothetical protein
MLVAWNVNAGNTSHLNPLLLTLTLLVARLRTNHANNAFALDHFAFSTNLFYRCLNFHGETPKRTNSFGSKNNSCSGQVVRRQLNRHLVTRKNPDIVHPHLA